MPNYYEILGVTAQASAAEIRKAYFKAAREKHPDRFTDPEERKRAELAFTDLTTAFNALGNDQKRAEYDASLAKPQVTDPIQLAKQAHEGALAAMKVKDFHQAVELLRAAVHQAPEEARYHFDLGRCLAQNPSWVRQAVSEFEEAVKRAPREATYQTELARAYLSQGLKIRARKAVEAALSLAPNDEVAQKLAAELGSGAGAEESSPRGGGGRLSGLLRRKP